MSVNDRRRREERQRVWCAVETAARTCVIGAPGRRRGKGERGRVWRGAGAVGEVRGASEQQRSAEAAGCSSRAQRTTTGARRQRAECSRGARRGGGGTKPLPARACACTHATHLGLGVLPRQLPDEELRVAHCCRRQSGREIGRGSKRKSAAAFTTAARAPTRLTRSRSARPCLCCTSLHRRAAGFASASHTKALLGAPTRSSVA